MIWGVYYFLNYGQPCHSHHCGETMIDSMSDCSWSWLGIMPCYGLIVAAEEAVADGRPEDVDADALLEGRGQLQPRIPSLPPWNEILTVHYHCCILPGREVLILSWPRVLHRRPPAAGLMQGHPCYAVAMMVELSL